ncbi:MAG: pilus assembly protein TadG-related protein [Asticcacaulis sp.]
MDFLSNLKSFCQDQSGAMAPMGAAAVMVVLLGGGLTVEATRMAWEQARLQNAADAAALSAAQMLPDRTKASPTAKSVMERNVGKGLLPDTGIEYGTWDPKTRTFTLNSLKTEAIRVTPRYDKDAQTGLVSLFGSMSGVETYNLKAQSVAIREPMTAPCIFFETWRNDWGSTNFDTACALHVNGKTSDAFALQGAIYFTGRTKADVVGGANFTDAALKMGAKAKAPGLKLAGAPARPANCLDSSVTTITNKAQTLSPGRYCKGLVLSGATVTLSPGHYFFDDAIQATAGTNRILGTGVTIHFNDKGRFKVVGSNPYLTVSIKAPTNTGVAIYQWPSAANLTNEVNGSLDFTDGFSGGIYQPNQDYNIRGSFAAKNQGPLSLVMRNVLVNPGGATHIYSDAAAHMITGKEGKVALVS